MIREPIPEGLIVRTSKDDSNNGDEENGVAKQTLFP